MEKHRPHKKESAQDRELKESGVEAHAHLSPGLYVVSTPIGNLRDLTFRALETLKSVHHILCEDTRNFQKLAAHYGIETPRSPFHEHNEDTLVERVLRQIEEGKAVAIVSDAGTPLISDPGYPLVREARARGIPVFAIPGPCAAVAALSISGFEPNSFFFAGFLPLKPGKKRKTLEKLLALEETIILYESPHKIRATLELLSEMAPKRELAIARELTKLFEEVRTGPPETLLTHFQKHPPKGEIVLLIRRPDASLTEEDELPIQADEGEED